MSTIWLWEIQGRSFNFSFADAQSEVAICMYMVISALSYICKTFPAHFLFILSGCDQLLNCFGRQLQIMLSWINLK